MVDMKMDNTQLERIYLVYQDETLMLDREAGNLEYAKRRTPENFFYHLYQEKAGVAELLDFFYQEVSWQEEGEGTIELTLLFNDNTKRVNRNLPVGWSAFVGKIERFIEMQEDGTILSFGVTS